MLYCFRYSDKGNKNYLTPQECANFLEIVCRMGAVISQDNLNPRLLTQMANFKRSIYRSVKKVPKIKYVDVQELIGRDAMMRELKALMLGIKRKSSPVLHKRSMSSPSIMKEMISNEQAKHQSFQSPQPKKVGEDFRVVMSVQGDTPKDSNAGGDVSNNFLFYVFNTE